MKRRSGNILLTSFILLTALATIVGSITYLVTTMIKKTSFDVNYIKCFYYAEAGLSRAAFFLKTSPLNGGYGYSWRTPGLSEDIGEGNYRIRVQNGSSPFEVVITSTGNLGSTSRVLQATYQTYPPTCAYPLYSQKKLLMQNTSRISGSILVDDDVTVSNNAAVVGGVVMVTAGHTVGGGGNFTQAPPPSPLPTFPTLDTSYYDAQILTAAGRPSQNRSFVGTTFLNGQTIYVNGDATLWGTLIGPGEIVATGDLTIKRFAVVSSYINLISKNKIFIEKDTTISNDTTLFGREQVNVAQDVDNDGYLAVLSPTEIYMSRNAYLNGIIHCGSINFENGATFLGVVMAGNKSSQNILNNGARILFNSNRLPVTPPLGLTPATYQITGSWKEIP